MTLKNVIEKFPNSFVILKPKRRNKKNLVSSWVVLKSCPSFDVAKEKLDELIKEGTSDAVIYNTSETEDSAYAAEVARFFRVYYNQHIKE